MGILTNDEMHDSEEDKAMEILELIADGLYNTDRPSHVVIKELVQVIKLLEERLNILGT